MKVLLINPPTFQEEKPSIPPLGLAYIAGVLRERHFEVDIIDFDLERDKFRNLAKIIDDFCPDILGIAALTLQVDNAYTIAKIVKQKSPEILVVVGGPHPSSLPERTLREAKGNIDIVVIGEGEYTFLEIVKGKNLEDIEGIFYQKNNRIFKNALRPPIANLDELPMPARDLLPIHKYRGWGPLKKTPTTHLIASRGCPFDCIFCSEKSVFGNRHRKRGPQKIVDEIEYLVNTYGMRELAFYDDLFTLNKTQVLNICKEIQNRKLKIDWKTLSRVNTVDAEMLTSMKASGCWLISYGFESGSQEILNNIRKKQTIEQCLQAAELTRKAGIKFFGFFMLGNVGETEKTICQTIQLAQKLRPDYFQFTIVRPDPGSYLYNLYRNDIENAKISWKEYYAFPKKENKMPVVGTELSTVKLFQYKDAAYMYMSKKALLKNLIKGFIATDVYRIKKAFAILMKPQRCSL
ncbi:MAG: radical SAM protein [Desulfobacterales bacterium]|nr:radical SAM protein [Desulfobacterales bacterium]